MVALRILSSLAMIALLIVAVYTISRTPQMQELLRPASTVENSLYFLERGPQILSQKEEPASLHWRWVNGRWQRMNHTFEGPSEQKEHAPQVAVPNPEVAQILWGALGAKRLISGIDLSVSDDVIFVSGKLASNEAKKQLLGIIDKTRGHRHVDSTALRVKEQRSVPNLP